MKTGIAMAGLALVGLAAAWPGPWPPSARVAAVRLGVRVIATTAQLRRTLGVDTGKARSLWKWSPTGRPPGRVCRRATS